MTIEYLVYANIAALGVFLIQFMVSSFIKWMQKSKENQMENKIKIKMLVERTDDIPKMQKDIDNAHEKIRRIEEITMT